MKWKALILCVFYVIHFSTAEEGTTNDKIKPRTVSTLLNAKWNSTPTALEIAEFLNDEDSSYFWSFLEDLFDNEDKFHDSKFTNRTLNWSKQLPTLYQLHRD